MTGRREGLEVSAWVLVATQVVHGLTPAHTEAHTIVGPLVGLVLVSASIAAGIGIHQGRQWGPTVLGWTGLAVAIGFVLYHALPFTSPVTHPYLGKAVGAVAWVSVLLAIAAGIWAACEGLPRRTT